jgi:hypothetical protein
MGALGKTLVVLVLVALHVAAFFVGRALVAWRRRRRVRARKRSRSRA